MLYKVIRIQIFMVLAYIKLVYLERKSFTKKRICINLKQFQLNPNMQKHLFDITRIAVAT